MMHDIDVVRTRLTRLEREVLMLQTGRLDWLLHVPRGVWPGRWRPAPFPFAPRIVRELEGVVSRAPSRAGRREVGGASRADRGGVGAGAAPAS